MAEEQEYKRFIWTNVLRGILFLGIIIGIVFLFQEFLPVEAKEYLEMVTDRPTLVFLIFLISETIIGIFPPEFFVEWASLNEIEVYVIYVILLGGLSIAGGIFAYGIGTLVPRVRLLRKVMTGQSFRQYARLYRRWGGIVIIISALTPLPFATISLLSASFGFPFVRYLLYASARILRFAVLGYIFWHV